MTRLDDKHSEVPDMTTEFEVRWEGELPATPQQVWDAFTLHTAGWIWPTEYAFPMPSQRPTSCPAASTRC